MFYVVCTYIVVCILTAIIVPYTQESKPKCKIDTIFDREDKIDMESDEIEKVVQELLNDV